MPSVNYNENQVNRWIGVRTVARAKELVAKVQNIQWQNNLLTGDVPGKHIEPFQVMVHFSLPQGKLHASGECTCPVKNNCRHVAAVMLAYLRQQPASQAPMPAAKLPSVEPVPAIRLESRTKFVSGFGHYGHRQKRLDFAAVHFDYGGVEVAAGSSGEHFCDRQGTLFRIERRPELEQNWLRELSQAGLQTLSAGHIYTPESSPLPPDIFAPALPVQWRDFIRQKLPLLRKHSWKVSIDDDFTWNVIELNGIDGYVIQDNDGWFQLEIGVRVGRRQVALQPLLAGLFQKDSRWQSGDLSRISDEEVIELRTERNERLHITADHLKMVVGNLADIFADSVQGTLRIAPCEIGRLIALSESGHWQFQQESRAYQLVSRLRSAEGIEAVKPPPALRAQLRDYQQQGLNWMQFLRAHSLSGLLADDMGLGKTIQTLAHLLSEKDGGRLDRPSLIVVPTTLVYNWMQEAERFAPTLRVLALTGPQRKDFYGQIEQYDVVLTTYSLLWRDQPQLLSYRYHLLILDEAQYVKNSASRASSVIRALKARHRLCLTGTPLENHLGELWAQFDFLLPGFLGNEKQFMQTWRIPIERHGDRVRRELLSRRVRPFMLRRRKQDVAKELPPKSTIIRSVRLEDTQLALYESVRSVMQQRIKLAMEQQAAGRSHLVVLDALLKLRQICCDPQLIKMDEAFRVKSSAKMTLLREMLNDLLADDRHILIFSQFTSMLALIADELTKSGISFVTLTGNTRDRTEPVRRFQNGEVPVFLISLKVGGVGLNLTAADTVIHYDPWWNPAAENQASDRAWRLGQDKPVFVYKLIAAGTIEEKIVALQQQKADLAEGILQDGLSDTTLFSNEDLAMLFNSA
ncbi:DEAD/DEAH box helicase [Erwinia tracheiphila]|uniref:Helicase n=1 Tax=Erwinia tracheiphila TaxID=65700 RepID=A0A0M2KJ83_9GAMM|nr:DEAD/DEAH box helicase [Erwinia tracheiphila]EOS95684.1 helicase/SNF2 domain-containing protein [Erwinia tracheiphila PSU-1]KKF37377.1 helicase [Erwinia tracheiphila]UIA88769.1 DEAD/DEAH box helicase [Erwinia tracheiphila]UIA97149.1 DEAD/DEAH box helicase [Erwinia tracheiphila]